MSTAMYRLLDYRPDLRTLQLKFRPWHVEALLNQAADLIDKCLGELREYSSLNYAWKQFQIDLEAQTKELDLDNIHSGDFERDLITARARKKFLTDSQGELNGSKAEAQKLYREGELGHLPGADWTRAGQNLREKNVEIIARDMDHAITDHRISWSDSDVKYNQEKLKLRLEAVKQKKDSSTPGQPLALDWQGDLILTRLKRNYEDALNRACVAEEGLERFYGHRAKENALPPADQPMEVAISNLAIWIRNSIEWLVAYQQIDQAFTRVVSIRSLVTKDVWSKLLVAKERFSTSLTVPAELFASHNNARLRGVGASLLGDAGTIPWSLIVRLPKEAIYQRDAASVKVSQDDLPSCLLGRVENRRVSRPLEISGLISLMNASPVGQLTAGGSWSLEIIRPTATSETFSKIEDVLLEINAVGQPK